MRKFLTSTPLIIGSVISASVLFSPSVVADELAPLHQRLVNMGSDAQNLNYRGEFILQQGVQVKSYGITHVYSQIDDLERIRVIGLEDNPSEIIKVGDTLFTINTRITGDKREQLIRESDDDKAPTPDLLAKGIRHYEIQRVKTRQVAGRPCDWIQIRPIKNDRLQHGFCLDQEHNLALKTETRRLDGQLIEGMRFIDIEFNPVVKSEIFNPPSTNSAYSATLSSKIEQQDDTPASLPINLQWIPPGFEQVLARQYVKPSGNAVSRFLFSDGFSSFSVFVEACESEVEQQMRHAGSTTLIVKSLSNEAGELQRVTLAGELPPATLQKISEQLLYP